MSSSSLENEDLDNVPLVRMEDVQPSRDRTVESRISSKDEEQVYETCIIDNIEYENECVVNDDEDSNIGSMVSFKSEEGYEEDSSSQELIIPEVLEEVETENDEDELETLVENDQQDNSIAEYMANPIEDGLETEVNLESYEESELQGTMKTILVTAVDKKEEVETEILIDTSMTISGGSKVVEVPPKRIKRLDDVLVTPPTESWPTLEILPGGVIKNTDKYETDTYLYPNKVHDTVVNSSEMTYACAKCSQTFKYLFCLVKHVKWHNDQMKIMNNPNMGKLTATETELINIRRERNELDRKYKKQKLEVLSRVGAAIGKINTVKNIFNK